MSEVRESIRVGVPLTTAYNQWTQFEEFPQFMEGVEEFPQFMEGVEEVRQVDDTHLEWRVSVAGRSERFAAVITEQVPDTRIAWRTTDGPGHAGAVDFHRIDDRTTEIVVVMDPPADSMAEKVADAAGVVRRRVRGDLERFKEMIEARGTETGAWRGEVERPVG